jgi:acylphosphatase
MKHYKIAIRGVVQGVYFRAHTQAEAKKLGLAGFVRNEPDGSVYIEAEGDEKALKQLVQWCHEGSPQAVVETVEVSEGPAAYHHDFVIIRQA